ncbi:MAG: hypothetical protein KJ077_08185 [Anaerolineae bacterium]|nr:hypothetical protein [Anaerolineae bacterium]
MSDQWNWDALASIKDTQAVSNDRALFAEFLIAFFGSPSEALQNYRDISEEIATVKEAEQILTEAAETAQFKREAIRQARGIWRQAARRGPGNATQK